MITQSESIGKAEAVFQEMVAFVKKAAELGELRIDEVERTLFDKWLEEGFHLLEAFAAAAGDGDHGPTVEYEGRTLKRSEQKARDGGFSPHVLNAFRHQRIKHPQSRAGCLGHAEVLNAFRHQRIKHSLVGDDLAAEIECSTPFGINESNTLATSASWAALVRVLNAFRHQRIKHFRTVERHARQRKCSTPFGINESNTCPPASPARRRAAVLNAFRHQRIKHADSVASP